MTPPRDDRREDGGWDEYRRLVVDTLERLERNVERARNEIHDEAGKLRAEISTLKSDVVMLKVKASVWGALGGLMTAIAAVLIAKFMK